MSAAVGAEGLMAGAALLSRSAEEFGNDPSLEALWAMKAMDHAEVYFNILCSVDPKLLRLTQYDDVIYKEFRTEFPNLKVNVISEDELKSTSSKMVWRPFCERFKTLEDYSFGTLLRLDSSGDYSEHNSALVPRIQFLAIELARNREGNNAGVRTRFKVSKLIGEQC